MDQKTTEEKRERYFEAKTFEVKTADIFEILGFEVELNRNIGGNDIDIYIKKKMSFGNHYEHYICECKDYNGMLAWSGSTSMSACRQALIIYSNTN